MPGGAPSKYDGISLKQVKKLAQYGHIEVEIADIIDVSDRTLDSYKIKHKEFLRALKEGKETPDREVVVSLHKRATGFTGPDGKYYPPDTTACIIWLKNRLKEDWRERKEDKLEVEIKGVINYPTKKELGEE